MVIAVLCCMRLARWQWDVSQHTHSLQNLAYALQWPLFGVFFAVMWIRMLRLESLKLDEQDDSATEGAGPVSAPLLTPPRSTQPPSPPAAEPNVPDGEDPESAQLAAYNRMLAELAVRDAAN